MLLYLDTSALVKIYIEEAHREAVCEAVLAADIVATHKVSFIETRSAFARLLREKKLDGDTYELLKKTFSADWENYLRIGLDSALSQSASEFAEAFALCAYDSIHLAAAHALFQQEKALMFACFDRKLNQAAKILGFDLL